MEPLPDAVIPLLRIHPKKMKTLTRKDICTPTFTAALFTRVETQKQPECPLMDEGIKKITPSEVSQPEKDNYCLISNKNKNKHQQQKNPKTSRKRDQTCDFQRQGVAAEDWIKIGAH